jgi:NAD(P)H-flavin reductase
MIRFEELLEKVRAYSPDADVELLRRAYVFSAFEHRGQVRHSGEPYLIHPLAVADFLADTAIVYACGPMPMLKAVGAIAQERAIRAQVAVEEAMACGIGVCMTCVLPVRDADGVSRFVRSCVEGPVFEAGRVRWADVGRLPADLHGADGMGR